MEWVRDLDGRSRGIVRRQCACSLEEAADILQEFVDRRLIERVGGRPPSRPRLDSYRCAWVKGPGS
jgi:hypothetical protein